MAYIGRIIAGIVVTVLATVFVTLLAISALGPGLGYMALEFLIMVSACVSGTLATVRWAEASR